MCIFLFKQKTAYEMRISDWSSDVCSSDLPGDVDFGRGLGEGEVAGAETHFEIALEERAHELGQGALEVGEAGVLVDQQAFDLVEHRDRKSVVSGKSVSVRVALGGRSIIKKNTNS